MSSDTLPPDGYAKRNEPPTRSLAIIPPPKRNAAATLAVGKLVSDRLIAVAAQARARLDAIDNEESHELTQRTRTVALSG